MKHILHIVLVSLVLLSCANIVAPSGGVKDTTPPVVEHIIPANESVNFGGTKILMVFDENIQISTGVDDILFSPPFEKKPKISALGKKLFIYFQDPLVANTTHIINFGQSIKDWNEGNPYNNLTYIFSTGAALDSVSLQGKVIGAENNLPVSDVQVMLYPFGVDSILTKVKPFYVTQTNSDGQFYFDHLKAGEYQIAALKDENFNYLYDQKTEGVAFNNKSIILSSRHKLNDDLVLFYEEKPIKLSAIEVDKGHVVFPVSPEVESIVFDTDIYNEADIVFLNEQKDSLHYWYSDSTTNATFFIQSGELPEDTLQMNFRKKASVIFSTRFSSVVHKEKPFIVDFSMPVINSDVSRVSVLDTFGNTVPFTLDFINYTTAHIIADWDLNKEYDVVFKKNAFTSYREEESKVVKTRVEVVDVLATSRLVLSFLTEKVGENIQVDLLDDEGLFIATKKMRGNQMIFSDLSPQKYIIKIYNDLNKSNSWDTGSFSSRTQAEKVLFYSQPQELKANWDKEVEIYF